MDVFICFWLVIGFIIAIGGCFFAGYSDEYEKDEMAFAAIFLALVWPAIIMMVLIVAPFYGIYKRGDYLRNNRR